MAPIFRELSDNPSYIQYQIHEIPSMGYLVMAEDVKKSLKFRQTKGNYTAIPDDSPIKLHAHNLTMVIYIQYKFYQMLSIGYLVMAQDGKNH